MPAGNALLPSGKAVPAMDFQPCLPQLPVFHFLKGCIGKGRYKRCRYLCIPGHSDGCPAIVDSQKRPFSVRMEASEKWEAAAWLWNIRKKN